MIYDALVIGSGQAGLAAGFYLQQAHLSFVMLEANDAPGGSWPRYYDSLVLNTPARYSSLPGLAFPGPAERYPARDEVVAYLRAYAAHFRLPIITGARVQRIDRGDQHFRVLASDGGCYRARTVVAATGSFGRPYRPSIAGQDQYRGQVLHMAEYRRPEPFRGQRVVIVGGGNGAMRVAAELASVARVTLAARDTVRYLPQRILGRDIHFWMRWLGLDQTQWLGGRSTPVYASAADRRAFAATRIERRPMFTRFSEQGVIWPDGSQDAADTVIFATGYRPNLAYLSGLGALDEDGRVFHREGQSTTVSGLYYIGLARQRNAASATLRGVGPDARAVVDHLRSYCQADRTAIPARPAGDRRRSGMGIAGTVPTLVLATRYAAVHRY